MGSYGTNCTEPTVKSGRFRKPQAKFLVTLFSTLLIVCGKANFTNLSRYSELTERTYRRQFKQEFDFARFKAESAHIASGEGAEMIGVMDCSFIAKSGKATFGLDSFWNGCASRVEKGLEISVVGVVDVKTEVSYGVSAQQTFAQTSLPEFSRMDQYLYHLDSVRAQLPASVRYLVVDGAYAKAGFVSGVVSLKLQMVGKLRCDANLRYLYTGVQPRRGRPRKYDRKVALNDLQRFTFVETVQPDIDLCTARVWHVSLKREIRLAYLIDRRHPHRVRTCLLFSTDVAQDPKQIYQFYQLRFQIEFIFRDAKQFTGLEDCQARDGLKLEFHFNASLTALNLAKFNAHRQHQGQEPFVFSMASVKRRALNQHLLERFITNLDLEPSVIKSHPNYSTLCDYGAITA